jgi:hypothetical protein
MLAGMTTGGARAQQAQRADATLMAATEKRFASAGATDNGASGYSALADCTVQIVGMLATPAAEAIVVPSINQIALVSRQSRSVMPSPS